MADSRRGFLKTLTVVLGAAVGAVLAWPLVRYVVFPASRRTIHGGGDPVTVLGDERAVQAGKPVRVEVVVPEQRDAWAKQTDVRLGAAWLLRGEDGALRAFSTTCPHLGCAVDWDEGGKVFRCPCHTSAFGTDGARLGGPAKRGLDPLEVAADKDGPVKVRFEKFVADTSERKKA
jgi:menaquinol-cytochrome c reductase iron-sulfur subunit